MSEKLDLTYKYYFSSAVFAVVEVKVNGLADGTPIGKIYHWLLTDRARDETVRLQFVSMGKDASWSQRAFQQGDLLFDEHQAKLQLGTMSEEIVLEVVATDRVPLDLDQQVRAYLTQDPGE